MKEIISKLKKVTNPIPKLFEPKREYWFKIESDDLPEIGEHFIKSIDAPKFKNGYGWEPITISYYDPVAPSSSRALNDYKNTLKELDENFNVSLKIKVLGPVSDIVEEWDIKDCKIDEIDFGGEYNYNSNEFKIVKLKLLPSDCVLIY